MGNGSCFALRLAAPFLAVVDDCWLPLGSLRFREKGSSGGHKGSWDRLTGWSELAMALKFRVIKFCKSIVNLWPQLPIAFSCQSLSRRCADYQTVGDWSHRYGHRGPKARPKKHSSISRSAPTTHAGKAPTNLRAPVFKS